MNLMGLWMATMPKILNSTTENGIQFSRENPLGFLEETDFYGIKPGMNFVESFLKKSLDVFLEVLRGARELSAGKHFFRPKFNLRIPPWKLHEGAFSDGWRKCRKEVLTRFAQEAIQEKCHSQ